MPLEMKGMKANIMSLLRTHDALNKKIRSADQNGQKLLGHVTDMEGAYSSIADDIAFATEKLGNGGDQLGAASSEDGAKDDKADAAPSPQHRGYPA